MHVTVDHATSVFGVRIPRRTNTERIGFFKARRWDGAKRVPLIPFFQTTRSPPSAGRIIFRQEAGSTKDFIGFDLFLKRSVSRAIPFKF